MSAVLNADGAPEEIRTPDPQIRSLDNILTRSKVYRLHVATEPRGAEREGDEATG